MQREELEPGAAALVVGPVEARRSFCLDRLSTADRSAVAVLPPDPAGVVEGYRRAGGEAPLTVVARDATTEAGRLESDDVRVVDVDAASLPAVGEAALATLGADGPAPPADRLWLADLSGPLERTSVQQVYRLLYILSEHVERVDGVGLYGLDPSVDGKTTGILVQPLDYRVTVRPGGAPTFGSLAGRVDGGP
jgi:hypothetical protein